MKYKVYDNGRPCRFPECKVDPSWENNEFDTFEQAEMYACAWMGSMSPGLGVLRMYVAYDYSGCGDRILITTY